MTTNRSPIGALPATGQQHALRPPIQAPRGVATVGLRSRILADGSIQVTGGSTGTDTFEPTVDGVAIVAAPVAWTSSHNGTAEAIAVAINAAAASHTYVATVSTDTVTIKQRVGGAATLTCALGGSAAATVTDFTGDTDDWTEFVSGATFDGDAYHELSWSGALISADMAEARATSVMLYCDGQAFQLWFEGLRSSGTAIIQGVPYATATWTRQYPWIDSDANTVIKLASDEELLYEVTYI